MRPAFRERKKKSPRLKVSLWFNNRHTLGPYRDLNQSEIVKGGPPPLISRGRDIPVRVCTFENVCAAVRQREVSSVGPSDKQSGCSRG